MLAYGQQRTYANSFTIKYQNGGKIHLDISKAVNKSKQRKLNKINILDDLTE